MAQDRYDVVVVGAGQAGPPLASALAKAGRRVALVERKHLGGSCVNFGCIPTKAAISSARVLHSARRAAEFGIRCGGAEADYDKVIARARGFAESSRRSMDEGMEKRDNPRLVRGHARLDGRSGRSFVLRVDDRELHAGQVVLDTGTRTLVPDTPGLAEAGYFTSGNWLEETPLPPRLLVLGGGAIGVEMAQLYARLGSRVTVVEPARLLASEDAEVSDAVRELLEDEGVEVLLGDRPSSFGRGGGGVEVRLGSGERREVDRIFVATGRRPNTDDLGLDGVGVETDERGFVRVDERLATSVEGVWAAGDIRGGPMFTHTAWDDFRVLRSQLLGDGSRTTRRIVPYAVFTDPELGRVGLTEEQAREQGLEVVVARFEMEENARAADLGETRGFIKLVGDRRTQRLLGAAVFAHMAAELVHCYVDVMQAGAKWSAIGDALHVHPTLCEGVQGAVHAFPDGD